MPYKGTKRRDEEQVMRNQTANAQTKKSNRETALEQSRFTVWVGGDEGSNQFYSREMSPLILMQLQITNICLVRIRVLFPHLWNITLKYILPQILWWNKNKWLKDYQKPQNKKNTHMSTMGPTIDINSQEQPSETIREGSWHLICAIIDGSKIINYNWVYNHVCSLPKNIHIDTYLFCRERQTLKLFQKSVLPTIFLNL